MQAYFLGKKLSCHVKPFSFSLFILTGANMSGKSTYLKQVVLLQVKIRLLTSL